MSLSPSELTRSAGHPQYKPGTVVSLIHVIHSDQFSLHCWPGYFLRIIQEGASVSALTHQYFYKVGRLYSFIIGSLLIQCKTPTSLDMTRLSHAEEQSWAMSLAGETSVRRPCPCSAPGLILERVSDAGESREQLK